MWPRPTCVRFSGEKEVWPHPKVVPSGRVRPDALRRPAVRPQLKRDPRDHTLLQRGRTAPIMSKVRIGIIGSRFQAECIAGAVKAVPEEGEVVAVASPSKGHAAGVLLLYAEELFFAPKYVKAKQLADEGAFGRVHLVKQGEKHSGPHSEWFWDVEQSGGGAVMDLGCHGIAFCWWFLGKPKIKSVYSQMATQVHQERTQGDDEAVTIIEFETGAIGMVESSWNRPGGMDDSIEVFGDKGQTYADLLVGNALPTYSEVGFGYAVEKAASTKGWTYPVFEEHWNYGFPQEMRHFARCVRGKETPISDGETGRVVQEALCAAYASAGLGRKITLPFRPKGIAKPIDLWKTPERGSTCAT